MPCKEIEDPAGAVIQRAIGPKRGEFDIVTLECIEFSVPCLHMLIAPIVRQALDPQPVEHLCPLLGVALFRIKRNDTPRDEILALKDVRHWRVPFAECGRR